jgi:hypothetical protein
MLAPTVGLAHPRGDAVGVDEPLGRERDVERRRTSWLIGHGRPLCALPPRLA